jgi:hypothetical protein
MMGYCSPCLLGRVTHIRGTIRARYDDNLAFTRSRRDSLAGWRGEALACYSTLKQRHLEDMDDEIGGYRSNNGQAITCRDTSGKLGLAKDSQDAYTSMNAPRILVDPVCGCSVADTEE